jgi:hypothetical protein
MISLVYVSSAVTEFDVEQLQELLDHSRQNNARLGVTGLLVYVGGNFLQILEGDEASVKPLYDRIGRDPRHRQLIKLHESSGPDRQFGKWSMALVNPAVLGPDSETESLSVIRQGLAGSNGLGLEARLRVLLKSFTDTMR